MICPCLQPVQKYPQSQSHQKQAKAYLRGQVPGVMQHYAPDATADPEQGWVESDETVHRLAHWREDSPY